MNSNVVLASSEGSTSTSSPSKNIIGDTSWRTNTYNDHDDTALSSSTASTTSSCYIAHTNTDDNDVVNDDNNKKPQKLSSKSIVHKFTHESRFLEILCSRKDTYGDVLYQPYNEEDDKNNNYNNNNTTKTTICNSCEYTGKLWFMKLGGIRFREVIQILDITCTTSEEDGSATRRRDIITLECTSSFKNSKGEKDGNNKFVPCARVTCQIIVDNDKQQKKDNEQVVSIGDIDGELLLPKLFLLLPGKVKKQIVSVITSTFRDAMNEYVDELLLL